MSHITMSHGAGGSVMQELIKSYILKYLGGSNAEVPLEALDDSGVVDGIVLKSDSHTVKPLFFPGGDIGRLSISGTVNDIAVMGAEPIALAAGLILEEGFPIKDLERILKSMGETCKEAGVSVITGDTKVVEKGSLEKCVINTSGVGRRSRFLDRNIEIAKKYRPSFDSRWLLDSNIRDGDKIIVSGTMGDHGIAILSFREGYGFESEVKSDVRPLNKLTEKLLQVGGVVKMKDPTRGGLANLLNEWSEKSDTGIIVRQEDIPISEGVRTACEMLGLDPLEIGNEGKIAIAVVAQKAEEVLQALKRTDEGRNAAIIGEATKSYSQVVIETTVGGKRILPPPAGDPVPRIC
ncbi:MAG: hydrogenase expression/formation protein HypE [Promethearchaeati archaeon SRVP18_Atabeyarchaeia-1]